MIGCLTSLRRLGSSLETLSAALRYATTRVEVAGLVVLLALIGEGLVQEVRLGRANLAFVVTEQEFPDIEPAQWIETHTAPTVVVMARQMDVVYHYSRRQVVWFPPLSNPQVLREGIRKHKVAFIIVSARQHSYWLPPEQECFRPLLTAYPETFQLVHEGHYAQIWAVVGASHMSKLP